MKNYGQNTLMIMRKIGKCLWYNPIQIVLFHNTDVSFQKKMEKYFVCFYSGFVL